MSGGGSLINLGDLSKPATVLVEKVCNAVGVIYEPTRIKRRARAEAEADKIKALSREELLDIEHRSVERFLHQESRKQDNIESITKQAVLTLPVSARSQDLDEDWLAYFFKQCDTVSDKDMQSLWARLLSGEATAPGTFSKRTVNFVSTIDKKEAALFTAFCQFVWVLEEPCPLVYELKNTIYACCGITFTSLTHLDAIGLISFDSSGGYVREGLHKFSDAMYFDLPMKIAFPADANNEIDIGHAILTSVGLELFTICSAERNQDFYEYVVEKWTQNGLCLSSYLPHS